MQPRNAVSTGLLQQGPLHADVSDALRELITAGELVPGGKVNEQQLCVRFGISRTPLREALKVLASEGLIELRPRRGAYVARITQTEIDELFPIMACLEALAGELAVRRLSDADLAEFRQLHAEMMTAFHAGDEATYLSLNREIHRLFFTVAANGSLTNLYEQILVRIHSVRFIARKTKDTWTQAVGEHEQMLAALENHDGAQLADILRRHLLGTATTIAVQSIAPP